MTRKRTVKIPSAEETFDKSGKEKPGVKQQLQGGERFKSSRGCCLSLVTT